MCCLTANGALISAVFHPSEITSLSLLGAIEQARTIGASKIGAQEIYGREDRGLNAWVRIPTWPPGDRLPAGACGLYQPIKLLTLLPPKIVMAGQAKRDPATKGS
jgi:hypothetical protein